MTGIPVHTPTNQGQRRVDDGWLPGPIGERHSPEGGGTRLGEVDRTRRGGGTGGGGGAEQPSLQQEEEREGKRKKGPRDTKNKGVNSSWEREEDFSGSKRHSQRRVFPPSRSERCARPMSSASPERLANLLQTDRAQQRL